MRIKWNRHLDGSASRQEGSDTPPQEADEKKRGASSSPGIFRIFRRKKNKKRADDDTKTGTSTSDGNVPPLSAEGEDDNASISSVATYASQPGIEVRQRDRAASLFSSFRLSLPGSKRKKRRIAPTPSETLINNPEDDHQIERYSTPDLRKPSEKLDVPGDVPVSLSTSSPSVRNSKEHSLVQNIESLGKCKSSNPNSPFTNAKLSKSVSFSNCGSDLNDFAHSSCDKNSPRAVNSSTMVEEDAGAVESELPICMSGNRRRNRAGESTSKDRSPSCGTVVSDLQKHYEDAATGSVISMTKTETSTSPGVVLDENNICGINSILNDLASEIRNYRKPKDDPEISTEKDILLPENQTRKVSESEYSNTISEVCLEAGRCNIGDLHSQVEFHSNVQNTEMGSVSSPKQEWNTLLEVCNNNRNLSLLPDDSNNVVRKSNSDNLLPELNSNENSKNSFINPSITTTLPELKSIAENFDNEVGEIKSKQTKYSHTSDEKPQQQQQESLHDKKCSIESSKHVVCHMRVYERENTPVDCLDASTETPGKEISCKFLTLSNSPRKSDFNCALSRQYKSTNMSHSLPCITTCDNSDERKSATQLMRDLNLIDSRARCRVEKDQEVPNGNKFQLRKNREKTWVNENQNHPFHEVPEFELSLLEFEDMYNKYASPRNFEFCDYNSIIPEYRDLPKRRSVLDTSLSLNVYPHFSENGAISEDTTGSDIISPVLSPRIGLIKENIKVCEDLEDACQSIASRCILPLPPKQWINYEAAIENNSNNYYNGGVCTDRVQCTATRGKNVCQQPCLEALPTTVMLRDSNSGGIDTPEVSSTLQTVQNKSGRGYISNAASEISQLSDHTDTVSNVGATSPTNDVLDYSDFASSSSETPRKSSAYLESEINGSYCCERSVGDVYSGVTKELQSLAARNYLNAHNFCDTTTVKFSNVINDLPCEFVQNSTGSGLIEISNPYQEDSYIIPHETPSQIFINHVTFKPNCAIADITDELERVVVPKEKDNKAKIIGNEKDADESLHVKENGKVCCSLANKPDVVVVVLNGDSRPKQNKLSYTEQKNMINKNKNSMIPCLKKKHIDIELKRPDSTKPKTTKTESPVPNTSNSRRVFYNQGKDPNAENLANKQTKYSKKYNGGYSDVSVIKSEVPKPKGNPDMKSDLINVEIMVGKNSSADDGNVTESGCTWILSDYSGSERTLNKEIECCSIKSKDSVSKDSKIVPCVTADNDVVNSCDPIKASEPVAGNASESVPNHCDAYSKHADHGKRFYFDSDLDPCDQAVQDEILPENHDSCEIDGKYEDYDKSSRRSSITGVSSLRRNISSSKESLNSQMTTSSRRSAGKSRIPRKQPGSRGAQPSAKGPVRPPMWLSKAELTQEIQRLGTLCEARTKELNRLKMETKHVSSGFDAFAALFKYMVEDLNGLSVPTLTEDLEKTLKQLELTKQDLAFYEREVEEIKSHHCQELNDLSNKLFEVYQSEVAELNAKHQEEINHLKTEHQKQMEHLTSTFDASSTEAKTHHEKLIANLEQEIINQREELQLFQEREIKDLEEKHAESTKIFQDHIEQLQKRCAELKQHSLTLEDAMRKDTDSKLQWVTSVKVDLEKEVESLKAVLEMKNKELHTLRVQNLEMEKQLDDLPLAREKIKMLQARAEDLEALMIEKTKVERKLSTENQQIRDTYEKETKVNRRLSMENEELQWRLRQAENSLISGSFTEVPEFPEDVENATTVTSPTKSPGPHLSRSVFFTYVDKDESLPHSPRSQYKKITSNFSANYKTSPAKSSKSPPAPSPRRTKSHSEPPQPLVITSTPIVTSTPRRNAKQPLSKPKGTQKRQRSGSDSGRPASEHTEVTFSSVTESMASSVSSESSVFEHKERLLEEHKEHIIQSLEILREQRSSESADENTIIEKKWSSDDMKITGELSKLGTADMSRSAEFADPKTYYHMTFPVLKESGMNDCDTEDGSKNVSSGSSPLKEFMSNTMHSMSENNINHTVETDGQITQVMSKSAHEVTVVADDKTHTNGCLESINRRNSCSESTMATESVQNDSKEVENRWRTI